MLLCYVEKETRRRNMRKNEGKREKDGKVQEGEWKKEYSDIMKELNKGWNKGRYSKVMFYLCGKASSFHSKENQTNK
jgi:hypothetical protein